MTRILDLRNHFDTVPFVQISVVIPTIGKRDQYLQETLKSVHSQTLQPCEIIIVNNGAQLIEIESQFEAIGIPIQNIKTVTGAGVSQARNLGATIAKGQLVAFLDDDDLWDKDFLRYAVQELKSSQARCVLGRIDKMVNGEITPLFDATGHLDSYSFTLMNPGATGSNVLIYRDTFLMTGGYDFKLPPTEDGALILSLIDAGHKVSVCSNAQAIMRMHSGVRLTNPKSAAIGFKAFYLKYGNRLGIRDKFFLIWKFRREEYRDMHSPKTLFPYLVFSFLIIIFNRRPRHYWKPLTMLRNTGDVR